jgi:hypothetical protein
MSSRSHDEDDGKRVEPISGDRPIRWANATSSDRWTSLRPSQAARVVGSDSRTQRDVNRGVVGLAAVTVHIIRSGRRSNVDIEGAGSACTLRAPFEM